MKSLVFAIPEKWNYGFNIDMHRNSSLQAIFNGLDVL